MRYSILLTGLFILLAPLSQAQYRKSTEVKAGANVAQTFSPTGFYRFARFSKGSLYSKLRSGSSAQLFNYNLLYNKIQFINNGDTMEIANPTLFDSLKIDSQVFYYRHDYGYLELIAANHPIRLVRKTTIKLKSQSVGAYDGSTTTSSISKMNSYMVGINVYSFVSNEDVVIKENIDWYWMNEAGEIKPATRNNLLIFLSPDKQQRTEIFIKENKINFNKEESLIRLIKAL
ncbi:MAG: hypothetical protein ABI480_11650 [Chitinophagaceae bacterium]